VAVQRADGHFVFELEADVSIPAEYILFKHFLGEPVGAGLEAKIAAYIWRKQAAHGGWPLFTDGAFNISSSVKAYFALKAVGDSPGADHMRRARAAILAHGARRKPMFSRAPCWRSSARCLGAACRSCRSRSCCCRAGFLST
jgi:squalene-hopene/tetraprenyl-beta-curcumene cyclase